MNNYLPIGTIVLLKDAKKKILIVGYLPQEGQDAKIYDYSGVPFPEGLIDSRKILLFDNDQIEKICHNSIIDKDVIEMINKVKQVKEEL
ncbi:MAG: DUF4176 domain-containing protein [Bacilli bacterium]|nr:DUF4176 domain-containing protein [Bacilli bacterium]